VVLQAALGVSIVLWQAVVWIYWQLGAWALKSISKNCTSIVRQVANGFIIKLVTYPFLLDCRAVAESLVEGHERIVFRGFLKLKAKF